MAEDVQQIWKCRERELSLSQRALIMGVLNVTPDSFSDGGAFLSSEKAITRAREMIEQGADIIDVGGESSRPGAKPVSCEDELGRVLPVVESLAKSTDVTISIDTTKAAVAETALKAGAHIVNDISGLTRDPAMASLVKRYGAGLVLMHMQGVPDTMQENPEYSDVVAEVSGFLREQVKVAVDVGVDPECIVVDPGIGFGKTLEHNVALLQNLSSIRQVTGRPILVGVSRKRFIGSITGRDVDDRTAGSLAAMSYAITEGAGIIRVHDVKDSCDVTHMMAKLTLIKDE